MKRLYLSVLLFFIAFFGFAEPVVLKIASVAPARSPWDVELKKMAQEWTRLTNGEVQLKFYDTTVLGGEKAVIQKLKSTRPGQKAPIDGALFSTVGLHELAPLAGFYTLSVPFLIQSQKELDAVLLQHGGEIEKKVEKVGCKIIAWSNVGWLSFYTKDSYKTLGELKKIKMATSGIDSPVLSDCLRISGFNVENVSANKFAQSLKQRSGPRGFFAVPLLAYAAGYYKDIDYVLDAKLCPAMAAFVISNDAWNRVPEIYKKKLIESAAKTTKLLNDALEKTDRDCIAKMKASGKQLIVPTQAELEEWAAEFNKNAHDVLSASPQALNADLFKKIQAITGRGTK